MLTILLSHERSGSHLLAEAIASLQGVKVLDEVCNPHAAPADKFEYSFFRFFHEWANRDPGFLLSPSYESKKAFNAAYFRLLEEAGGQPSVVVDIKYAHVHHFEAFWWPILRRPYLFVCGQEMGVRFIHLYRQNVIEASVSTFISAARKVWHSWQVEASTASTDPIEVPVRQIVDDADLLAQQSMWMGNWLGGTNHLTLTYEEINAGLNGDNENLMARIAAHVDGVVAQPYQPKLKKLGQPLRESLANYDELVRTCEGTAFATML